MDKTIIYTIILILFAGVLFWGFQSGFFTAIFAGPSKPVEIPGGIILFYGEGCPHCKNVDDFVEQNKITDKVNFANLEVWYNKDNNLILQEVAKKCGINADSVGVPFLYDPSTSSGQAGKCYVGEVDVINFFKNEAGIK
jgi:hypothetical protein